MSSQSIRAWSFKSRTMFANVLQKWTYVLVWNEKSGTEIEDLSEAGPYPDFAFMFGSGLLDCQGREIFEGDRVRVFLDGQLCGEGLVGEIPDMHKSRSIHPLDALFKEIGLEPGDKVLEFEIVSHVYI